MSSMFIRIQREAVDAPILERISEQDVVAWMAAKVKSLQEGCKVTALHHLEISSSTMEVASGEIVLSWNGIGRAMTCSGSQTEIAEVMREIKLRIGDSPREKIKKNKAKAKQLLKEADELAATLS